MNDEPMETEDPAFLRTESQRRVPGWANAELQLHLIEKGGSDRHYYRVEAQGTHAGPDSVILMVYTDKRPDNLSFFSATEIMRASGARAPQIYSHDETRRLGWIEDLGRRDLWDHHQDAAARRPLYASAMEQVSQLHRLKEADLSPALMATIQPPFDEKLYQWEQDYFFDEFAARFSQASPARLSTVRAQNDFADVRRHLAALPRSLVHRDFQSQNVIIRGRDAWLIDYQGIRYGRPEYDVASLVYDPYININEAERHEIATLYFAHRADDHDWETSPEILARCACQRLMQALGAYGKLGVAMKKPAFLAHIPRAASNLRDVLRQSGLLPALLEVLELDEEAIRRAATPLV
jgi:N-acetylmuramate 1-kinase